MKKSILIFPLLALLISPLSAGELGDALKAYDKKDYATAYEKLLPLAKEGSNADDQAKAQYFLGRMYYHGHGVEENKEEAAKWYKLSFDYYSTPTEEGSLPFYGYEYLVYLSYYLGKLYQHGIGVEKDETKAAKLYEYAVYRFKSAAPYMVIKARYELGDAYFYGRGVERNIKKALLWYKLAAEDFNAIADVDAQHQLGEMYDKGIGIKRNKKKATKLYKRAAKKGNVDAQIKLGDMYRDGEGVKKNYKEAVKWYTLAANQGHPYAQMQLGDMYRDGKGVEENKEETTKWHDLALENYFTLAQEGNADARMQLGDMYRDGKGVEKNKKKSDEWYSLAFESYLVLAQEKNDPKAQMQVAKMYETGQGVEKNYAETIKWYKLAFKGGYTSAAVILGNAYHVGDSGTKKDLSHALMWYILAKNRALKNNLEKEMTPEQIKEAKRLAKAYKKSESPKGYRRLKLVHPVFSHGDHSKIRELVIGSPQK